MTLFQSKRPSDKFRFLLACIVLGLTSMVAQIVFIREMLAVFGGNELCIGVLLFVWLLWVGIGSYLGNRVQGGQAPNQNGLGQVTSDGQKATRRVACPKKIFSKRNLFLWYIAVAVLSFLTIFLIRSSKLLLGMGPAEIVGFLPMSASSLILLAPFCFVLGFVFVLNAKAWQFSEVRGFLVNRVYLWESMGAGLGGILTTFVLVPIVSNFDIIGIIALLNLLLGVILWSKYQRPIRLAGVLVLFMGMILVCMSFKDKLERFSETLLWRNLPLVKTEDSKYGNIAIVKDREQTSFYENGLLLFSYPSPFSSEEAIHFALSQHPNPQRLLLIGGGLGGVLTEALKYKNLRVDYVELDSKLIGLAKEYLPAKEAGCLASPSVNVHLADGRMFVREWIGKEKYDVIIMNLPDPMTLQLNRFYTVEFFGLVKKILKSDGIFSFRVSSAENYISPQQGLYLSSLYRSISSVFRQVVVLPGSSNIYLASQNPGLFYDWSKITDRLNERSISTQYVNQNFLPYRLSQPRIDYLENAISKSSGRANYDLEPISFFYSMILWGAQFKSVEKPLFLFLYRLNRWSIFSMLIGIWMVFVSYSLLKKQSTFLLASGAIFLTGATSIFLEIVTLLSFQAFYGYLYSKAGLILSLFMSGLGIGAIYGQARAKRGGVNLKDLALVQLYQVLLVFLLLCSVIYFWGNSGHMLVIELELYLGISLCGIVGGMEFVLANHIYLKETQGRRVGSGYSIDLWGSAASSFLGSVILIPILGIPAAMVILLLVNTILFSALILKIRLSQNLR